MFAEFLMTPLAFNGRDTRSLGTGDRAAPPVSLLTMMSRALLGRPVMVRFLFGSMMARAL